MSDEHENPGAHDDGEPKFAAQVLEAAERGDYLGFVAAAHRYGSLEDAQTLVRSRGIVRSVDRCRMPADSIQVGLESRAAPADQTGDGRTMFGHFSVFDEWTEINSAWEGRFLERVAPGAFKKTFRENRAGIQPLFQHGRDPVAGDKPLGPVDDLREDSTGAYYEVPLLDAPYVHDIEAGLREGLYGASFRFQAMREEFVDEPDPSDYNPTALPERTLKEMRVFEFGPVTFPAYPGATASLRSAGETDSPAPSTPTPPAEGTSEPERREPMFKTREEYLTWISQS